MTNDERSRWLDFLDALEHRPGMWLTRTSYCNICDAIVGFDEGLGGDVISAFSVELSGRANSNSYFPSLVAREAAPLERREWIGTAAALSDAEATAATAKLFELLRGFVHRYGAAATPSSS